MVVGDRCGSLAWRSVLQLCFDSWDRAPIRGIMGVVVGLAVGRGCGACFAVVLGFYFCHGLLWVSIFVFWVAEYLICKVLNYGYWLWQYRCSIRGFGLPVLVGFGCVFWV